MIRELIFELYNGHRTLVGDGAILVLFIASIIVMLSVRSSKGRKIAPLFLSVSATIGVAIAEFIKAVRNRYDTKKAVKATAVTFACCLCILACAVSGRMVFSGELSGRSENNLHIPNGLVEAMDEVLADCDEPAVITMPGWGLYLSAYSSAFSLLYEDPVGGDMSGFDDDVVTAYTELEKKAPNMRKLSDVARKNDCSYFIISRDVWPEKPLTEYGYELLLENDECCVYREVTP